MIQLPDGFDAAGVFTALFHLAAPFAGIALLIACGFLISNMLRNAPK